MSLDSSERQPLLLLNGMFSEATDWLRGSLPDETSEETESAECLALQLANAGYDVWVGVPRGRPYSDTHATFDLST